MKVLMQYRKSTKGTHVYDSVQAPSKNVIIPVKTIYISQEALDKTPPDRIEVTIEVVE